MKSFLVLIMFCLAFLTQGYSQTNTSTNSISFTTNNYLGSIILISVSKSCHCVLEKCKSVREAIKTVLTNKKYEKITFTEIDYSSDWNTANDVLNKYQLSFLPCFVVFDEDKIYYKDSNNFDNEKFIQALDDILERKKKK